VNPAVRRRRAGTRGTARSPRSTGAGEVGDRGRPSGPSVPGSAAGVISCTGSSSSRSRGLPRRPLPGGGLPRCRDTGTPARPRRTPPAACAWPSGGSASVRLRSTPGCPRPRAAAAGTIVPSADGNAAIRTRPSRRPTWRGQLVLRASIRPRISSALSASSRPAAVSRIRAGPLQSAAAPVSALQPGDVMADRRLRVVELLRRGG